MPYSPELAAQNASFVQFAYNMFANDKSLNPAPDPGIAAAGFELIRTLTAKDFTSTKFYGYLAQSKTDPGELVLAIRGTETAAEWLLDFSASPMPYQGMGLVALGFRSIAESFQLTGSAGNTLGLTDTIRGLQVATPIHSLTILGHSLGSALATLAAAELAATNPGGIQPAIALWTYASPRVGLADFMNNFNRAVQNNFRIWNVLDLVPEAPVFPYVHVGGDGQKLDQSLGQMHELVLTPRCEHSLASYQWLLDAAAYPLNSGCKYSLLELPIKASATKNAEFQAETVTSIVKRQTEPIAEDRLEPRGLEPSVEPARLEPGEREEGLQAIYAALQQR